MCFSLRQLPTQASGQTGNSRVTPEGLRSTYRGSQWLLTVDLTFKETPYPLPVLEALMDKSWMFPKAVVQCATLINIVLVCPGKSQPLPVLASIPDQHHHSLLTCSCLVWLFHYWAFLRNQLREWSSKRLAIKGHSVIAFGSKTCNGVELLPNTRHQARLVINTVLAAFMWIAARSILIFWNTVFWLGFLQLLYLSSQKKAERCENIRWVWGQLHSYLKLQVDFCLFNLISSQRVFSCSWKEFQA